MLPTNFNTEVCKQLNLNQFKKMFAYVYDDEHLNVDDKDKKLNTLYETVTGKKAVVKEVTKEKGA